jgi:hypothetical protein
MYKFLFSVKNYAYEACNPTVLNLSIILEKISLELLDYRSKISYIVGVGYLYVYLVVTSADFLVVVQFLMSFSTLCRHGPYVLAHFSKFCILHVFTYSLFCSRVR